MPSTHSIIAQISQELENYKNNTIEIVEGYPYSQFKLVRRIMLYKNQIYPKGKLDSQGNYKYWFDIISPRVQSEVKNIDFDTKDIVLASEEDDDAGRLLIANASLRQYLKATGQAAQLNEAVERNTEWGNVLYKKVKGGYKLMDLNHVYILNQIAESLEDSDVIEEEIMYSVDLRKKIGVWDNVQALIDAAKVDVNKSSPEFYVYERNGEITEKAYNEAKGKEGGDETKYVMVKVIVGGNTKHKPREILFCDTLSSKPYKESHRGTYSNRWMRVGMYEILFDIQTRANEIGNQIARGLEWSSKTVFRSSDRLIAQNIITDLQNGDVIKSTDLQQVNTRMDGLDQLIADWNRLMTTADKLANSYEVVTGEDLPSGTPFSLAAQQNANANKLFDFIREKLALTFQDVLDDWILPELLKNLKCQDVLKITSDESFLQRYYEMIVDDWYVSNLIAIGVHAPEEGQMYKQLKLQELMKNDSTVVKLEKEMWANFLPRVIVNITGENFALANELETIKSFIQLEQDPVRRSALIEMAMKKKNIDVSKLPKTPPLPPQPAQGQSGQGAPAQGQPNALDQALQQQK